MREAIGSTFLFKILMVFIVFFTSFLAIAINYSQAFSIKNKVISLIEQYEGYNDTSSEKIEDSVKNTGYYRDVICSSYDNMKKAENINGVCLRKINSTNGSYYQVSTFVKFNLPLIGDFMRFRINGETSVITNTTDIEDFFD